MATFSLTTNLGDRLPPSRRANATACPADMGTVAPPPTAASSAPARERPDTPRPGFICSKQLTPVVDVARASSGLTNGQLYHFVVVSVDAFGNATPSERIDGTPQPTEDLWRRYRDDGGGAGGCFIATAAFGSYENRWVYVLRDFRDEVLLSTASGREFVDWYYAHSPPAAAWIAERGWARALTRVLLVPFIACAWFWLYVPPLQKAHRPRAPARASVRERKRIAPRSRREHAA